MCGSDSQEAAKTSGPAESYTEANTAKYNQSYFICLQSKENTEQPG